MSSISGPRSDFLTAVHVRNRCERMRQIVVRRQCAKRLSKHSDDGDDDVVMTVKVFFCFALLRASS